MRYCLALLCNVAISISLPAQLLVLPGDYPDPSVTKIGNTYWASATTSNWLPAFPLLHSQDLVNWKSSGAVFTKMPDWADYYFWAPEITYDKGRVYMYYAAHKKKGNLCVGVASADKPEGPYRDHGPLMCEVDGSIDAFPMRDENGKLFLIWKEDGNSVGKPTPIWAMEMNEERTALIGEKKQLFRNTESWEANLVEGVSIMKHGEYFYAFYAAAGCCGKGCTYATGVARTKNLLGAWEKYEKNPLIKNNDTWICPGHGTPVEKDNKFYFLYHAYDKKTSVYTGRQGLLQEFVFTKDGWVEFLDAKAGVQQAQLSEEREEFNGNNLSDKWQWSVAQDVNFKLDKGRLQLQALPSATGAFLGQKTLSGDYDATTRINVGLQDANAGIAAIGNEFNIVGAFFSGDKIKISHVKEGKQTDLFVKPVKINKEVYLRMQVRNGKDIRFSYSSNGKNYILLNEKAIDGSFLPPWDRAVRAGILSKGEKSQKVNFDSFVLRSM